MELLHTGYKRSLCNHKNSKQQKVIVNDQIYLKKILFQV